MASDGMRMASFALEIKIIILLLSIATFIKSWRSTIVRLTWQRHCCVGSRFAGCFVSITARCQCIQWHFELKRTNWLCKFRFEKNIFFHKIGELLTWHIPTTIAQSSNEMNLDFILFSDEKWRVHKFVETKPIPANWFHNDASLMRQVNLFEKFFIEKVDCGLCCWLHKNTNISRENGLSLILNLEIPMNTD